MANTRIQVKRSSVSGRTPNVSNPSNTSYIAAGEFALNMADNLLYTSNGSSAIIVGAAQKNITANTVSANDVTIANGISVGNSTVNASINSTSLFAGNTSVNTTVNTTYISVSNSISNSSLSPRTIFVGNSVGSVTIDTTGGTANLTISKIGLDSTGIATIQTSTNHNIVLDPLTSVYIDSPLNSINNINYNQYKAGFKVTSLPSANQLQFAIPTNGYKGTSGAERGIKRISRTNGVALCVTGNHEFTGGERVYIRTTTRKGVMASFETNDSTITYVNSTAFTYPNGPADVYISLSYGTYSVPSVSSNLYGDILITITPPYGHSLSAGQTVNVTANNPITINAGSSGITFVGKYVIASVSGTTSFTIKLGTHVINTKAVPSQTGSFSSSAGYLVNYSYNESIILAGAYDIVGQYLPPGTTATGNVVINTPVGISIGYGNNVVKITDTIIYVGNTSTGYAITSVKAGKI